MKNTSTKIEEYISKYADQKTKNMYFKSRAYGVDYPLVCYKDEITLLAELHEAKVYWDAIDFGFGETCSTIHKQLKAVNKSLYRSFRGSYRHAKEWYTPKTVYMSQTTGELHNGLWPTIKSTVFGWTRGFNYRYKVHKKVSE